MGNLRQSCTGEEWDELSERSKSNPLPKVNYSRSEVKKLIYEFAKDAMITKTPETDTWINFWIESKLKL